MTALSTPRFRLGLVALFGFVLAVTMILLGRIAHAAAVPPMDAAVQVVDGAWSLVEQYGPVWGGALLLFGGLGALLRRNASTHWIAQGRALALITGVASTLGALLEWRLAGAPSAGVVVTAFMAIKLILSPTVAPADAVPVARNGQAGFARLALLVALAIAGGGLLIGASSCGAATQGPTATAAKHALWDCTAPARAELVDAATPLAVSAIEKIEHPDRSLDSAAIQQLFSTANLRSEAGAVIACVAVRALVARSQAAPQLRTLTGDPVPPIGVSAAVALEQLRAAQFPGVHFVTPEGTI